MDETEAAAAGTHTPVPHLLASDGGLPDPTDQDPFATVDPPEEVLVGPGNQRLLDGEKPSSDDRDAADHTALGRLLARYGDIVNRQAWEELADVMLPECRITLDLGEQTHSFPDPDAFAGFMRTAMSRFEFFQFSILNSHFQVAPDRRQAAGRTTILEHRQLADGALFSNAYGLYQDRFVRTTAGWLFATRWYQSLGRTATPGQSTSLTLGGTPRFWRLG